MGSRGNGRKHLPFFVGNFVGNFVEMKALWTECSLITNSRFTEKPWIAPDLTNHSEVERFLTAAELSINGCSDKVSDEGEANVGRAKSPTEHYSTFMMTAVKSSICGVSAAKFLMAW